MGDLFSWYAYVRTYVRMCPSRLGMSRWRHVGMSRCHACGLRNSECRVCVRKALSWPSERDPEALCLGDLGRRRVELKVWRRTERGLQVEEEESVVFFKHRGQGQARWAFRAWGSGGDGIYRAHTQRAVRERGRRTCPPVHLATTEARFLPD